MPVPIVHGELVWQQCYQRLPVYKAIWTPTIGKELSVQPKDNNKHSIAVIKDEIRFVTIISLLHFAFDGEYRALPLRHLLETHCLLCIMYSNVPGIY